MNPTVPPRAAFSHSQIISVALLQSIFTALVVISNASLWIDEFGTWKLSQAANLHEWWRQLRHWSGSDTQFPLYHFYMYFWTRFVGDSEYILRLSNVPLFFAAQVALLWPFRRERPMFTALVVISSVYAFLWYYLNEARAYVMIYLGACITLAAIITIYRSKATSISRLPLAALWWLTTGIVILSASSLLGVPQALGALVFIAHVAVSRNWHRKPIEVPHALPLLILMIILGVLGIYYLSTLLAGARATKLYETNFHSLGFALYEIAGLGGLGPGRLAIREHEISSLGGYRVLIATGALAVMSTFAYGLRTLLYHDAPSKSWGVAITCVATPVLIVMAAGYVMHWRVLGRHLMPLAPIIVVVLSYSCASLWAHRSLTRRLWVVGLGALLSFSAVETKLRQSVDKDDYRSAAAYAREALASGKVVWWVADSIGAEYYHVPLSAKNDPNSPLCPAQQRGQVVQACNMRPQCAERPPMPEVAVLSKPDIHDTSGTVEHFLLSQAIYHLTELPAFHIYRRADQPVTGSPPR